MTIRIRRLTEKGFLAQVRKLARLCGWLTFHCHDSRKSEPGFPDLVLVRRGRLIFAELKVRGRPRPEQAMWLRELRAVPGVVAVCLTPDDWDSIEEMLR